MIFFISAQKKKKKIIIGDLRDFFPLLICLFQTHSKPRKDFLLSMPQKKQLKILLFSTAKLVKQLRLRMKIKKNKYLEFAYNSLISELPNTFGKINNSYSKIEPNFNL